MGGRREVPLTSGVGGRMGPGRYFRPVSFPIPIICGIIIKLEVIQRAFVIVQVCFLASFRWTMTPILGFENVLVNPPCWFRKSSYFVISVDITSSHKGFFGR